MKKGKSCASYAESGGKSLFGYCKYRSKVMICLFLRASRATVTNPVCQCQTREFRDGGIVYRKELAGCCKGISTLRIRWEASEFDIFNFHLGNEHVRIGAYEDVYVRIDVLIPANYI